jgi:hypothetical protein
MIYDSSLILHEFIEIDHANPVFKVREEDKVKFVSHSNAIISYSAMMIKELNAMVAYLAVRR